MTSLSRKSSSEKIPLTKKKSGDYVQGIVKELELRSHSTNSEQGPSTPHPPSGTQFTLQPSLLSVRANPLFDGPTPSPLQSASAPALQVPNPKPSARPGQAVSVKPPSRTAQPATSAAGSPEVTPRQRPSPRASSATDGALAPPDEKQQQVQQQQQPSAATLHEKPAAVPKSPAAKEVGKPPKTPERKLSAPEGFFAPDNRAGDVTPRTEAKTVLNLGKSSRTSSSNEGTPKAESTPKTLGTPKQQQNQQPSGPQTQKQQQQPQQLTPDFVTTCPKEEEAVKKKSNRDRDWWKVHSSEKFEEYLLEVTPGSSQEEQVVQPQPQQKQREQGAASPRQSPKLAPPPAVSVARKASSTAGPATPAGTRSAATVGKESSGGSGLSARRSTSLSADPASTAPRARRTSSNAGAAPTPEAAKKSTAAIPAAAGTAVGEAARKLPVVSPAPDKEAVAAAARVAAGMPPSFRSGSNTRANASVDPEMEHHRKVVTSEELADNSPAASAMGPATKPAAAAGTVTTGKGKKAAVEEGAAAAGAGEECREGGAERKRCRMKWWMVGAAAGLLVAVLGVLVGVLVPRYLVHQEPANVVAVFSLWYRGGVKVYPAPGAISWNCEDVLQGEQVSRCGYMGVIPQIHAMPQGHALILKAACKLSKNTVVEVP